MESLKIAASIRVTFSRVLDGLGALKQAKRIVCLIVFGLLGQDMLVTLFRTFGVSSFSGL